MDMLLFNKRELLMYWSLTSVGHKEEIRNDQIHSGDVYTVQFYQPG